MGGLEPPRPIYASGHVPPDLESRMVVPVQQCYFWQETPKFPRYYELEHCHDEAAMTSFPTVLFFSPSLNALDVARCF